MSQPSKLPVVGVRMPTWGTFAREVFPGIADYMREHGKWRIETPLETTNELHPVRICEGWHGDGLIVFRYTPEEAEEWMRRGIKVVNFSSECLDPRIPNVTPDNREAGRLAAQHLMGLGLRNFAFWDDPERVYSRERREGFVSELAAHDFECMTIGAVVHKMVATGKADRLAMIMDREISKLPHPVGLFAKDDLAAMEIMRSCERLGLSVPDRVSVIGCNDDHVFCFTAGTPVTSVRYPGRLIGYRLAERLDALFSGERGSPERTLVPVSGVISRESTGMLQHAHPHVREALKIISREAPQAPLHVQEVLDRVASSKSALSQRFHDETGETMKEAIDRVRSERLRDLLARTPLPIKVIAEEMRFESQEELSRFFKRIVGVTPSDFRKSHRVGSETFVRDDV